MIPYYNSINNLEWTLYNMLLNLTLYHEGRKMKIVLHEQKEWHVAQYIFEW